MRDALTSCRCERKNGDRIHYKFQLNSRPQDVNLEMTAVVHVRSILMSVKLQVRSMNRARLIATRCEPMLPISTNQRAFRESPRDMPDDRYALSHAQSHSRTRRDVPVFCAKEGSFASKGDAVSVCRFQAERGDRSRN